METEHTPSEKSGKIFCKCPECKGQFFISPEMLENKLLCPHCNTDVSSSFHGGMQNDHQPEPSKSQLPPPKKEKIHLARRISTPRVNARDITFEDRQQSFIPAPKESPPDKVRLKKHHLNQEKSSMPTFFLVLGSLAMLTIAGVFYYKILNLPDITKLEDPVSSLLIDTEEESQNTEIPPVPPDETFDLNQNILPLDKENRQDFMKRQIISKYDLETALDNIKKFCAASTDDEKAKYVYASEDTIRPMKEWTQKKGLSDLSEPVPFNIVDARVIGKIMVTTVSMGNNNIKTAYFLYDDKLKTWLLDWFSWVQYQEKSFEELMKERPETPVAVRVNIGMAANYEAPFESTEKPSNYEGKEYINIDLRFDDSKTLRGYIDRRSELAVGITKELMSGPIPAMVTISFPPKSSGAKPDQVVILNLVRIGWLGDAAQRTYLESIRTSR